MAVRRWRLLAEPRPAKQADPRRRADRQRQKLAENIRQKQPGNEKVTEFDLNGDKKPDVWTFTVPASAPTARTSSSSSARRSTSTGTAGSTSPQYYDEREQIEREALDLDFDGKVDSGQLLREGRDRPEGARPGRRRQARTLWLFYEKGKLVRKERDTNGDGKVDYWEYWEGDQVDRIGEDLDGDGNVDAGRRTRTPSRPRPAR